MFVHAKTRSLLVQAPNPSAIMDAMPAVAVRGEGFNVGVKHTAAATLALRRMGLDAPSPIVSYYNWPKFKGRFDPFGHQKLMAEFMTLHRRCFNLAEMGSGKTNSVLWALDWLMREGVVRKAVVLAPLSTLERVWNNGVANVVMHRRAVVVHGSREKRLKLLAGDADLYILNHDALSIGPVREALEAMEGLDVVVVDEGSKFRNSKTDRYRALEKLVSRPAKRPGQCKSLGLWWLTGTPTPSAPSDAWAQVRLVSPDRAPRFFGRFRDMVELKITDHLYKPKVGHEQVVYEAMQPAIHIAKADCLDLPPMVTVELTADMSEEQLAAYKQMSKDMQLTAINAMRSGEPVKAVNAADRINKLRQIMMGVVKGPNSEYLKFDYNPRLKVLREAIDMSKAKAIVIVPFKGIVYDLADKLSGDYTCAVVNGDVGIAKRNKIFASFSEEQDPKVLLCHPEVMSHGLELTAADTTIFYGPMYGNDSYRQVIERFNRPPQDKKMTQVRIGCNAVEWSIYRSLDTDETSQQLLLSLYKAVVGAEHGLR